MEKLRATLNAYHMNDLKEMARYLKISSDQIPARKTQLVQVVQNNIRKKAKSITFIKKLKAGERAVLALVLKHQSPIDQQVLALPLMLAGMVYIEGLDSTQPLPRMKDLILHLLRLGLLVNLSAPSGTSTRRTFNQAHRFSIAPEVRAVLPRHLLAEPQPHTVELKITEPTRIAMGTPTQFLRQLFFVWAELRRQPAKRLKAGGMSKRDLRRIAQSLKLDVDEDRMLLEWMYAILQALRVIKVDDASFYAAEGKAVTLFWNDRATSQLRDILQQYSQFQQAIPLNTSELMRYFYYSSYAPLLPANVMRKQVMGMLQQMSQFTWVPLSLFISFLTGDNPGQLTMEPQNRNTMYNNLRWYGGGRSREQLEQAMRDIDMQAVRAILDELRLMGIVDLGYTAADTPIATFRVTQLAHAHFNKHPFKQLEGEGQVVLQPDFQILAMGPVPLRTLANLERFAEREKQDESVISYRLTRNSAYQAFQNQENAETIQQFLSEATTQPVPQNVARSLEDWCHQYERIVVRRNVTVMQVDAADTLRALASDKVLKRYLHVLDDKTAWFRAKDAAKVAARLNTLTILPAYSQGREADLPRSLQWQDNALHPRRPLPSLYVTGTLRRMAEPVAADGVTSATGWQLTPQTIQSAVATGMDIPSIITLLEEMTGMPLPGEWEKYLKAWGKHYGDGDIASVKLLHLEDAQTLQELRRADRRLSRWLRPLPKSEGLAVVNEQNWAETQALLAEWGVVITESKWW